MKLVSSIPVFLWGCSASFTGAHTRKNTAEITNRINHLRGLAEGGGQDQDNQTEPAYTYLFDEYDHFNNAPHAHAVEADGWVYITGQMPVDETTDEKGLPIGIEAQTKNVFDNLNIVLGNIGLTLDDAVYVRAFLQNFQADYDKFNEVYPSYFEGGNLPGRTCVGTTGLAQDALVEVDLVLRRGGDATYTEFFDDFDHFNRAPHAHAVEADGWIYVTGQMPVSEATLEDGLPEGVEAQTENVFANLNLILDKMGLSLNDTVYVRAFLRNFQADYGKFNKVYDSYFEGGNLPGRTCVGVSGLAQNALVEIDLVLKRDSSKTTYTNVADEFEHFNKAPHSHTVEAGGWVYVTGQMPVSPQTLTDGLPTGVEAQTENVITNLNLILGKMDLTLNDVVYTRAFLQHFQADYKPFNKLYGSKLDENLPGRTCVGVNGLAQDSLVEIDLLLYRSPEQSDTAQKSGEEEDGSVDGNGD